MEPRVQYLLSLSAIRDRAQIVWQAAQNGHLTHFDIHEDQFDTVAEYVTSVIERDFGPDKYDTIPPHGRWQHFEVGNVPRIGNLIQDWKEERVDDLEITRRLVDLFFVSVILDAGAGDHWRYDEPGTQNRYERSEGIAVASLHMFRNLSFTTSQNKNIPLVDGKGLEQLTSEDLITGFQVTDQNQMLGIEPRAALLRSLGKSLLAHADVFGADGRPGKLVDHMLRTSQDSKIDVIVFWGILQSLLIPIWPKDRTTIDGHPIGDAWPLTTLQRQAEANNSTDPTAAIQPFHKLTQWLTYSLMVPLERVLGMTWINGTALTALAEYRNGGLFVDLGALTLKREALDRGLKASGQELPIFDAGDDVIVEWRALTISLLDVVYGKILTRVGEGVHLTMAQVLEAGTWKSGREIAAERRPKTKSSPILIKSDGTVF